MLSVSLLRLLRPASPRCYLVTGPPFFLGGDQMNPSMEIAGPSTRMRAAEIGLCVFFPGPVAALPVCAARTAADLYQGRGWRRSLANGVVDGCTMALGGVLGEMVGVTAGYVVGEAAAGSSLATLPRVFGAMSYTLTAGPSRAGALAMLNEGFGLRWSREGGEESPSPSPLWGRTFSIEGSSLGERESSWS